MNYSNFLKLIKEVTYLTQYKCGPFYIFKAIKFLLSFICQTEIYIFIYFLKLQQDIGEYSKDN